MQYEAAARKLEEETARALKEFKQNKLEHEVKHAEELLTPVLRAHKGNKRPLALSLIHI